MIKVSANFNKKYIFFFFLFLKFMSYSQPSFSMDKEFNQQKIYHTCKKSGTFIEGRFVQKNNASGFELFDLDRKSAIDLIKKNLPELFVKVCVKNEINEFLKKDKSSFDLLFPTVGANKNINPCDPEVQLTYLRHIQNPDNKSVLMLGTIQNFFKGEKNPYMEEEERQNTYGLEAAIAFIKKENLEIYIEKPGFDGQLELFHRLKFTKAERSWMVILRGQNYIFLSYQSDK